MKRTNTFEVRPRSESDGELLRRLLDASASLWNELTYERRQRFFADESIWSVPELYDRYKGVLGSTTAQQVQRKNDAAWRSFFALLEDPDRIAHVPGYWGNEADGRELRTYIRNDAYTLEWGDRSRLEITVGATLKEEYGLARSERLRLEVAGQPKWTGDPCQPELYYDETSETFRAIQPVEVPEDQQDLPLASNEAALDVGANNLVACTTTTGQQYLYGGLRSSSGSERRPDGSRSTGGNSTTRERSRSASSVYMRNGRDDGTTPRMRSSATSWSGCTRMVSASFTSAPSAAYSDRD